MSMSWIRVLLLNLQEGKESPSFICCLSSDDKASQKFIRENKTFIKSNPILNEVVV